jgi:hypothetical protein
MIARRAPAVWCHRAGSRVGKTDANAGSLPVKHPGASEIYQRFQGLNLGIPHFSGVEQAMTRVNL